MNQTLNLSLHKAQLRVFSDPAELKVICAGRRFGKSRLLLTTAIYKCLSYELPIDAASPPTCAIIAPTFGMARQIHWNALLNILEDSPIIESISRTDYRIKFKGNRPDLLLRGANDPDRLRGLKLAWVGADEFQNIKPSVWEEILTPALSDTKGSSALVIGSPLGRVNHFYRFCEAAKTNPKARYWHFRTKDNPFFPIERLKHYEQILPPRVYRQEFEASFESFEGQIFDCFAPHHRLDILPAAYESTFISIDPGVSNPAIVVVGLLNKTYYAIDAWVNRHPEQSVTTDELIGQAARFATQYNARRLFIPDDRLDLVTQARRFGNSNNIQALRLTVAIKRNLPGVQARMTITNTLFKSDRLYINARLTDFIDELESYRRAQNSTGEFIDRPAEGQNDHRCDSLQYLVSRLEFKNDILARSDDETDAA